MAPPSNLHFIRRDFQDSNNVLITGCRNILIDTSYHSHTEETLKVISSLGVDLRQIHLIINTHCHGDHVGANWSIQQLSGARIAMH